MRRNRSFFSFSTQPLKISTSWLIVAFSVGCATTPNTPTDDAPAQKLSEPQTNDYVNDRPFEAESLYALLVAEMAIDRKRYDIALNNYSQQALATEDVNVVARAAHISQVLKSYNNTLELAALWKKLDPNNLEADQVLVIELINNGRYEEAYALCVNLLENGRPSPLDSLAAQVPATDTDSISRLEDNYRELSNQYKKVDTLLLGHSFLLEKQGRLNDALIPVERARALRPSQIQIAMQEIRILEKLERKEEALDALGKLTELHPENIGLRARYARLLANSDIQASQREFLAIHEQQPLNGEILLSLALVSRQAGNLEQAEEYFQLLVSRNQHVSLAAFNLGELQEANGKLDEALATYISVPPGDEYIDATVSAAQLMTNLASEPKTIDFIRTRRLQASAEFQPGLYLVESDVLAQSGQVSAAEKILSEALSLFPKDARLLYSRAMMYTRLDHIEGAEKDLLKILELNPKNPMALNALGYTLADKTERLQEAYSYIAQAYELKPQDPAVIDSMGWIEYRLGNHETALEKLKLAMSLMPDHEIAAHLGEVLWVTGEQEAAKKAWREGLELKPDSKIIHSTIHRLEANLD